MQYRLNNILPDSCYPLEGHIILREKDKKNISLMGLFKICKDSDTIYIITDTNSCYPKFEREGNRKIIRVSCDSYPGLFDYELIAKAKIVIDDMETDNIQITGIGRLNANLEITMNAIRSDEIRGEIQPLFSTNGDYCKMNIW